MTDNEPFRTSRFRPIAGNKNNSWRQGNDREGGRASQREEFLKREGENNPNIRSSQNRSASKPFRSPKMAKAPKPPSPQSLEQKLDKTTQWLEETFPHLFAADDYAPLDEHILRDLKQDYKNNQAKKNYPLNLAIKAAIYRYKTSPGYLYCLKEGAPKYALDGRIVGNVTKEEERKAQELLLTL